MEYVVDQNATQAAKRAGYSEKTSNEQGSYLLAIPSVKNKITELQRIAVESSGITKEMVIDELKKIGFADVKDYLDAENLLVDLSDLDRRKTAAVKSIKRTTWTGLYGNKETVTFELHDKQTALEMLGKHLGLFEADNTQKRPAIQVNINKIQKG